MLSLPTLKEQANEESRLSDAPIIGMIKEQEAIEEAQNFATQWLWTYKNDRPNIPFMVCRQTIAGQWGIGSITPAMKLKMAA